jgi:outer membrane protein assembly factor BamB
MRRTAGGVARWSADRVRHRRATVVGLVLAVVVTACSPAVAYQIGVGHNGFVDDDALAPPLTLRWSRELAGSISYPLIAEGKVFVTAKDDRIEPRGTSLHAFDQATGETLWSRRISASLWSNAAYDAGRIFVIDGTGLTQAFDATSGALLWSISLYKSLETYSFNTPPTAANGLVYTSGSGLGNPAGKLFAIRASDGSIAWTQPVAHGGMSTPALSATSVFVSYSCGVVYAFDRTSGQPRWQNDGPCTGGGGTMPAYHDGKVYARDFTAGNEVIDAETGATEGTFEATLIPAFADGIGLFLVGDVAFDGDTPELRAVKDGQTLWTFTGQGELRTAPIVAGSTVFVGGSTGIVYGLDLHTGQLIWSSDVGPYGWIWPPNEQGFGPLTGLGAGEGVLVVPAFDRLVVFSRP